MNIAYIVFGERISYHREVVFSILSFLTQLEDTDRVIVVTDRPEYYRILGNRITIEVVSPDLIRDWKGKYNYVFRTKIKGLLHVAESYPDQALLYLDGDTFLYGSLNWIKEKSAQGYNLMHTNEGYFKDTKLKSYKSLLNQIKKGSFAGVSISKDLSIWNAGAVCIGKERLQSTLKDVLKFSDDLCDATSRHYFAEQFSFDVIVAQHTKTLPMQNDIGHYWSMKEEWGVLIDHFFIKHYLSWQSLDELIEAMKQFDFNQIPVYKRVSSTRNRILNQLFKIFPDREFKNVSETKIDLAE